MTSFLLSFLLGSAAFSSECSKILVVQHDLFGDATAEVLLQLPQGMGIPGKLQYVGPSGAKQWESYAANKPKPADNQDPHHRRPSFSSIEQNLLNSPGPSSTTPLHNLLQLIVRRSESHQQERQIQIPVVDLGSGDGGPGTEILKQILNFFTTSDQQKVYIDYIPVDVSLELLDMASKNADQLQPNVKSHSVPFDLETGSAQSLRDIILDIQRPETIVRPERDQLFGFYLGKL